MPHVPDPVPGKRVPGPERVRKAEASRQTSEVGAVCRKAARTVLCGGRPVMGVPTAIAEMPVERGREGYYGAGAQSGQSGGSRSIFDDVDQ